MSKEREMSLTLDGDEIWLTIADKMYKLDELDAVDLLARLRAILERLATGENISADGEEPYLVDKDTPSKYRERLVARYVDIG